MKKLLFILILLLLLSGCSKLTISDTPIEPEKQVTSHPFEGLEELFFGKYEILNKFVEDHFRYIADKDYKPEDYYRAPETTFKLRGGDCEDLAIFYGYFLEKIGYEVFFLNIYATDYGHAICVFKVDDKLMYTSNLKLINKKFDSILSIVEYIRDDWYSYKQYTFDNIVYGQARFVGRYVRVVKD